jgi:hypothetical protein
MPLRSLDISVTRILLLSKIPSTVTMGPMPKTKMGAD